MFTCKQSKMSKLIIMSGLSNMFVLRNYDMNLKMGFADNQSFGLGVSNNFSTKDLFSTQGKLIGSVFIL